VKVLITSGGTRVPIDDVRHISNSSTGKFGAKVAIASLEEGHSVFLLRAETAISPFAQSFDFYQNSEWSDKLDEFAKAYNFCEEHRRRYEEETYKTFDEYMELLQYIIEEKQPDIVMLMAAVSDFGVKPTSGKISSSEHQFKPLALERLPKVIKLVKEWDRSVFLVGFKLLVGSDRDDLVEAAWDSVERNRCDLVVANDLSNYIDEGFHRITLVRPRANDEDGKKVQDYAGPLEELAQKIIQEVSVTLTC